MGKKKMTVQTTCGVLITDGENLLICHPTNGKSWDIPKGRRDEGETDAEAAVRELREETGIRVPIGKLDHLGVHDYKRGKRLSLFIHRTDRMPEPTDCFCASKFEWHGRQIPEMDGFDVVTIGEAIMLMNPDMARVLSSVSI